MKRFLRLGLFLAFAGFLSAQDSAATKWSRTYGFAHADDAIGIAQTDDGGYVFAGSTQGDNILNTSAWLTQLKSDGSVMWSKGYPPSSTLEHTWGFDKTGDGGFVLCGFGLNLTNPMNPVKFLPWVIKVKGDGSVSWKKSYSNRGQDFVWCIQHTSDGGFALVGSSAISPTESAAWIMKLDGSGIVTWLKEYTSGTDNIYRAIRQTTDGGFIVVGTTKTGTHADLWILKLDSTGAIAWQKQCDGGLTDLGSDIQPTPDGGYIATAASETSPGHYESWVLKLATDGSIQWQKRYDGGSPSSISTRSDGGYLLATGAAAEAWIAKLTADGTVAWQRTSSGHLALSIHETSDHGFVVAGSTPSFGTNEADAWVLKGPADGSIGTNASVQSSDTNAAVSNTAATVTDRQVTVSDVPVTPVDLNPTVTQQVP